MSEEQRTESEAEERKQLRPYRRLVGALFAIAVVVASVLVLRGIIRHLDRLPSVDALAKPKLVDVRALRACAEDLERLELRIRTAAGQAFSALPPDEGTLNYWEDTAKQLEIDRLSIVARCRLNEPSTDPVVSELETAASEVEELLRSYSLLYGRHLESGAPHVQATRRALKSVTTSLGAR